MTPVEKANDLRDRLGIEHAIITANEVKDALVEMIMDCDPHGFSYDVHDFWEEVIKELENLLSSKAF